MSSFNINGPNNRPMIQESQHMQNNGGGGNLGYMRGRGKDGEENQEEILISFEGKEDTFEKEDAAPQETGIFEKIISFFIDMFKKILLIFAPKPKPQPKDEFLTLSRK